MGMVTNFSTSSALRPGHCDYGDLGVCDIGKCFNRHIDKCDHSIDDHDNRGEINKIFILQGKPRYVEGLVHPEFYTTVHSGRSECLGADQAFTFCQPARNIRFGLQLYLEPETAGS